jgi:predicted Zn-dependent protease
MRTVSLVRCRCFALGLLILLFVGCATTNIPPLGSAPPPFQLAKDERMLWEKSEAEEEELRQSGQLYEDRSLQEYLSAIASRLTPSEVKETGIPIRVHVLKGTHLDAFAYPNGAIYLSTGLLARVENEAQVATVVATQLRHVIHRDALRQYRAIRNKALGAAVAQMTLGVGLSVAAGLSGIYGPQPVPGLSPDLAAYIEELRRGFEDQADVGGLRLLAQAGYDLTQAPRVLQLLGDTPRTQERIANYERRLQQEYAEMVQATDRITSTDTFQRQTWTLGRDATLSDITAGRFDEARIALERALSIAPEDAKTHFYLGELYRRQRKDPADAEQAIAAFHRAMAYDLSYAEPYKSLSFLYMEVGNETAARQAFERYLELSREAEN